MKADGRRIVVDASTTLPLYLPDEQAGTMEALLVQAKEGARELLTSPHWRLECWSGLLAAERRGRIGKDDARAARADIRLLPITRLPDQAPEDLIHAVAHRHRLSIYDAANLALALQEGALLATGDRHLAEAAREYTALWT